MVQLCCWLAGSYFSLQAAILEASVAASIAICIKSAVPVTLGKLFSLLRFS